MTSLGSFPVIVERVEVEAFRAATGLPPAGAVPATFTMRWLAAEPVREALLVLVPEPKLVPVHESQTFDYLGPLAIGEAYSLQLDARRETAPERLILSGQLVGADGDTLMRVETILRLFAATAVAA